MQVHILDELLHKINVLVSDKPLSSWIYYSNRPSGIVLSVAEATHFSELCCFWSELTEDVVKLAAVAEGSMVKNHSGIHNSTFCFKERIHR